MRTTLTIDDDLMLKIKETARATGKTYKDVINQALRSGLSAVAEKAPASYSCRTYSLGVPREADLIHALALADAMQDEEIARKLQLKK